MIHANITLILTVLTLFYDIAARFPIAIQEETLLKDLEAFFTRIHLFYRSKPDAQSLFRILLLRLKERAVFQRQRMDPSLGMYSFRLLELLRGGCVERGLICRAGSGHRCSPNQVVAAFSLHL